MRGLLHAMGDDFGGENPAAVAGGEAGVSYRLESVKCGKAGCASCPHGPYWYAYFREGKRLRSRYIGRELPDDVKAAIGDRSETD